ncbi:CAP domain-containing protein [Flavobacterium sp.]|uniref:CAP domain-containing protein n=1 Tax=Flavobacterium sp. TaxID=239 RepID=UPI00344B5F23
MNSCSSDSSEESTTTAKAQAAVKFEYSAAELSTMKLINDYRVSKGLIALEQVSYVSLKSEEHDHYMIDKNVVSHDGFVSRSEDIVKVVGAKNVGENIAYNFNTPEGAVSAWLKSASHKENIEGNFTHFGIAIRENATTGKKYYTNIFIRI